MNTKGVDISEWQEGIDILSIKNNGYEYAILRAGFTYTSDGVSKNKDACFEDFYNRAKEIDFPVGAYWYSCANTYEKGVEEAQYMYENCLKGKKFEYPIYIDVEEAQYQEGNWQGVTDAITGFCKTLEDLNYSVGIYASLSRFGSWFDKNLPYTKWVACWSDEKPNVDLPWFEMWQNSSNGNIDGFRIDTDYCYVDFPSIIKEAGRNGYEKEEPQPEPEPTPEPTPEPKPYKTFLVKVYEVDDEGK